MKNVKFSSKPPKIHTMIVWNYAYRAARKGGWEEAARDRTRFQNKIKQISTIIEHILTPGHRQKILSQQHTAIITFDTTN